MKRIAIVDARKTRLISSPSSDAPQMTRDEKIQQIRKFIEAFQQIVATADVNNGCKQALPRFSKCEQNLIGFLSDAGFGKDASIVESHARHIPATYGAPLIHTIRDDVEFYVGKLEVILEDLLHPISTPAPTASPPPAAISRVATWSDIERNLNNFDVIDTETLRAFSRVSPPASQNPAFHVRFSDAKQQIRDMLRQRSNEGSGDSDKEPNGKSKGLVREIIIGVVVAVVAGASSPWWWTAIFPKPPPKVIAPECSPEALRSQLFRAASDKSVVIKSTARTMREKFNIQEFECVSGLATVLLEQDQGNGHGLYFKGETWRVKATADPRHFELCRELMRDHFFKYLANEPNFPLSERDGDGRACYERESGYCTERTAWIYHLMAIDFYRLAEGSTDKRTKLERLERAAKYLKIDLDFGGFDQITPSTVLKDKIEEKLKELRTR
jgi:hypothetical protein